MSRAVVNGEPNFHEILNYVFENPIQKFQSLSRLSFETRTGME